MKIKNIQTNKMFKNWEKTVLKAKRLELHEAYAKQIYKPNGSRKTLQELMKEIDDKYDEPYKLVFSIKGVN